MGDILPHDYPSSDEEFVWVDHDDVEDAAPEANSESSVSEEFDMVEHSDCDQQEDTASQANSVSDNYPIRGHDESEHASVVEALTEAVRISYSRAVSESPENEIGDDDLATLGHGDPEAATARASVNEDFLTLGHSNLEDTAPHKIPEHISNEEEENQLEDVDPSEDAASLETMENTLDETAHKDSASYEGTENTLNENEENLQENLEGATAYDSKENQLLEMKENHFWRKKSKKKRNIYSEEQKRKYSKKQQRKNSKKQKKKIKLPNTERKIKIPKKPKHQHRSKKYKGKDRRF